MSRPGAAALATAAAVLTLGACGTTYIDTDITVPSAGDDTATTLAPIDPEAPLSELLAELETLMAELDERIIDQRRLAVASDHLDDLWRAAERQIRANDPDDVFNFQQAIDLARSGLTFQRPADASKGYKIITDVIADYLADA